MASEQAPVRFDPKIAVLLRSAHERALGRHLPVAVFTSELFATANDRDNPAAERAIPTEKPDLVKMAVHGPRNAVDKVLTGADMHR